ncbi:glycosyltransferase family 2 protein [Rhodoferax sp. GW822-FHT02A01]|uniref:glycosyltransferase family 2 protein n=1 Tax=Rhodoferax sp. GW822-FHT02A01 TaxID=3141537 RepID=UPI00315D6FE3
MCKLSICIPTFNRATELDKTIESIVSQDRFIHSNDVEIVVSDNCSEDSTREVVERYVSKFKNKVFYRKTTSNISDRNFQEALSMGRGTFLKLNNDTLSHKSNSLDSMISEIDMHEARRPVMFFSNGLLGCIGVATFQDFESFVSRVSYWSTWIGGFGIWKCDFDNLDDFNRMSSKQLLQVDVLLRMAAKKGYAVIDDRPLFRSLMTAAKGGYDFLGVFMDNYLSILQEYRDRQMLSDAIFSLEKKRLLLEFILPWHVKSVLGYGSFFSFAGKEKKFRKHYPGHHALWMKYYLRFPILVLKYAIKQMMDGISHSSGSAGKMH